MPSSWLPEVIENEPTKFSSYEEYLAEIYSVFCTEIRDGELVLFGQRLKIRFSPFTRGKENAFWHITQESDPSSENKSEEERLPDLRRMKRLNWIAPILKAAGDSNRDKVLIWISSRPGPKTYLLSLLDFSYVVVVQSRATDCLLITAYPVGNNRRLKLRKEYGESVKVP